jgi:hypothetical protein
MTTKAHQVERRKFWDSRFSEPGYACRTCWDLVVSIFAQPPSPVRQRLYRQLHQALRPDGTLVLECKVDVNATGENRYPGAQILCDEIAPLTISLAREQERELNEGQYHLGVKRTVQVLAVNSLARQ